MGSNYWTRPQICAGRAASCRANSQFLDNSSRCKDAHSTTSPSNRGASRPSKMVGGLMLIKLSAPVSNVKMWRSVVVVTHGDNHPKEPADFGHGSLCFLGNTFVLKSHSTHFKLFGEWSYETIFAA